MIMLNEIEQGSAEWNAVRLGIPTASCFDKIITTKGLFSKQAEKYMYRLAGERVSGTCEESYTNGYMQRGRDVEAEAREFYELTHGGEIQKVGFCYLDEKKKVGCSPDGLIGKDGMIQIKCPIMSTHIEYLLDGKLPTDYFTQVQGELFVTGRKWSDFLSYYPGIKPLVVRVERDENFIAQLQAALKSFCDDLDKVVARVSQ